MDLRKALLGAASLLALTAASHESANAALSPVENSARSTASNPITAQADPVFELLSRTNGSLTGPAVENALLAMFGDPSRAQVEMLPNLLASLSGFGASSEVITSAKQTLVDILSSARVDDRTRDAVLDQIEAVPSGFKLAQRPKKKRDPDEVGQVPTGQS